MKSKPLLDALFLTLLLLTSCATRSSPPPSVPPPRPSPASCLSPRPEPVLPPGATLVRPDLEDPRTDPEGFALTLNWMSDVLEWGRELASGQEKRAASPECKR